MANHKKDKGHISDFFKKRCDFTYYSWIFQQTGMSRSEWEREASNEEFEEIVRSDNVQTQKSNS